MQNCILCECDQGRNLTDPCFDHMACHSCGQNLLREKGITFLRFHEMAGEVNEEETSGTYRFKARYRGEASDEDLIQALELLFNYPAEGSYCMHNYDCCGHLYTNKPRVVKRERYGKLRVATILVSWYKNI